VVEIRLERTGAIVGQVADRNGEGLPGVAVVGARVSGRIVVHGGDRQKYNPNPTVGP